MTDPHLCTFPEVVVGAADADGDLEAGAHVLVPCPGCGERPLDHLEAIAGRVEEFTRTLVTAKPITPLYHWAPTARRRQIIRWGLRPHMRETTSSETRQPVICFADSPSWAWALSGDLFWTPSGEWDLWQTDIGRLTDPHILPDEERLSGIYEVRTEARVYKSDLWYVATRTKP